VLADSDRQCGFARVEQRPAARAEAEV
jgi:hypothetical protein